MYFDDIIALGKDFNEYVENLRELFGRLRAANLHLNPKKCSLFQAQVGFLGFVVTKNYKIETDPKKSGGDQILAGSKKCKGASKFSGIVYILQAFRSRIFKDCYAIALVDSRECDVSVQ